MILIRSVYPFAIGLLLAVVFQSCSQQSDSEPRLKVIFDTDANNELDDQHAMAYLFFNSDTFDVVGVTINATRNGGNIDSQHREAERVMKLCTVTDEIPLFRGANDSFEVIRKNVLSEEFDGKAAVNFIIEQAHQVTDQKLLLLAVGKLTNIALALQKDSSIASKVRIVWLGSNYPDPGEYNLDNDIASLNFILDRDVPFEIVTVRYGKPSGTAAVTATRKEINQKMPGKGPRADEPVTGRHGGTFTNFGDYSVNLYEHIETHDEAGSRALFDMAAVAIVKNPGWAQQITIPAPTMVNQSWVDRPANPRKVIVWENFKKEEIMTDFYEVMNNYHLE